LVGRRSEREGEGCFVVEGVHLLEEVLSAGADIEAVYVDAAWSGARARQGRGPGMVQPSHRDGRLDELLGRCWGTGARVFELEPGVLARVAGTVAPQPVVAVVKIPVCTLADLEERALTLVVVCVDVRDPGNAGTVVRSALAAGAGAVVCCGGTVDLWNPKAVRSSAGAVLHVPVVPAGPPAEVLDRMATWGLRRWGAVKEGGEDYALAELARPCALVLGNEASGLPLGELGDHLDGLVSIPMADRAESLNVGMAAAVLCFEAARQRRHGLGPAAVRGAGAQA
jgi:TrmH family RNA methyltransferase